MSAVFNDPTISILKLPLRTKNIPVTITRRVLRERLHPLPNGSRVFTKRLSFEENILYFVRLLARREARHNHFMHYILFIDQAKICLALTMHICGQKNFQKLKGYIITSISLK